MSAVLRLVSHGLCHVEPARLKASIVSIRVSLRISDETICSCFSNVSIARIFLCFLPVRSCRTNNSIFIEVIAFLILEELVILEAFLVSRKKEWKVLLILMLIKLAMIDCSLLVKHIVFEG